MGLGILITVNNTPHEGLTNQVSTVEVYEKIDQATTYKIRFMVDICDEDIAHSMEKNTDPGATLGVLVEVNDQLSCLVSGPVSKQEAHLQNGGAGSWMEVEGTDTSLLMDRETITLNQTGSDADIVSDILQRKYNQLPDVDPTPSSNYTENKHTLVQKETDLAFIRRLAQRNGYHFWITYDKNGTATGHFKSRSLQGTPTAELLVNLPKANIDNLQIKWDTNRITQTNGSQVDLNTKQVITSKVSLSDDETLGAKGLDQIAGTSPVTMQISPPADEDGTLQKRGEATLADSRWFIDATCKTTINRICKLVRNHTLVNIQGLGKRHSGKYYVTGVKHLIDFSAHTMELELARNAWGNEINNSSAIPKIF